MRPESFFHVAIKVGDLETSAAFYEEQFDGEVIDRGAAEDGEGATAVDYVALEVADKRVYLFDRAPYEAAGVVDDVPRGILHFGFVVADADAASEDLADAGADFLVEPTTFGDLRIAFFTDPDGVVIELIEHLE
jgi:catechol 2,3-dioxygenase-like lactoylglutathione lyase family enzyme